MEDDTLHARIFDAISDPLVVIDDRGDVHAANAAALRLFDLAVDAPGSARARIARVDLDVRRLAELVRSRQKLQGVPLTDRAGRETGVVLDIDPAIGSDGRALLHFRAPCESLPRQLWTDEAVATVAHEFRSPLSGMRSALHVLGSGDAGTLTEPQRRFIDMLQRGVGRLARIVDGYLDLARLRAGVLSVERAEHDVRALIFGITGDLALCHPALASRIDVAVEPRVGNAFVDPDRLAQVVLNLVYNAARFTPDTRRVAVRVRPAGREALDDPLRLLPFDLVGEPRLVCIEVEDEGIGMSPDVLAHVFDRYHADPRDPSTPPGGAHLGLHISRSLVEAQDGWMHIESRLGEGTTASVYLPAEAAAARMLSRLHAADEAVRRLRAARRPAVVALLEDTGIRDDAAPTSWPGAWAVNPARVLEETTPTMVWVLGAGLAMMVTPEIDAFADGEPDRDPCREAAGVGACRVGEGMTFAGALRAAAANLEQSRQRRAVRAGSGVEVARE
jgi:signal transduction histidine kinase